MQAVTHPDEDDGGQHQADDEQQDLHRTSLPEPVGAGPVGQSRAAGPVSAGFGNGARSGTTRSPGAMQPPTSS